VDWRLGGAAITALQRAMVTALRRGGTHAVATGNVVDDRIDFVARKPG
jgi:hypothetical protein